jgi:hypothetical protein
MAAEAAAQPETRLLALGAIRRFWPAFVSHDTKTAAPAYVKALAAWAQSIAHVREPASVGEIVCAPWRTVLYRAGDCDDVACAVAAFAATVGLPAAVGIERDADGQNAHAVALIGDDWTNEPANRGRLTHVIDQRGLRLASTPTAAPLEVYPVSLGK